MEYIVFYGLATVAVTAALVVVLMNRAIYSALALIVCFGAVAGLFFQLEAQFVAAVQVIVYAGAIMVLFLFVIMLLDPQSEKFSPDRLKLITVIALTFGAFLAFVLVQVTFQWSATMGGLFGRPDRRSPAIGREHQGSGSFTLSRLSAAL